MPDDQGLGIDFSSGLYSPIGGMDDWTRQQLPPPDLTPPPPPLKKDTGTGDMLAGMTPEQWAAMSNPGVPWQGGENIAIGLGKMAMAPGQALQSTPENPVTTEQLIKPAADIAMATAGAASPFAEPGAAGIFGGKLAQTADLNALSKAEGLAAKGSNATDIWNQTGWFQGADKQWRFEIPDQASKFTGNPVTESLMRYDKPTTMGEAFSHPDLYAAYPQLQQAEFGVKYNPELRGIYQPPVFGDPPSITLSNHLNLDQMRSTNLHELQHGVQDIEGFAKGGNTYGLKPGTPAWDIYQERLKAMTTPLDRETYGKVAGYEGPVPEDDYAKYLTVIKNPANFADRAAQTYAVENAYRRQAGEVEARNVQARADLPSTVLQSTPPHVTQDVPTANQFVTFRNPDASLAEQMQASIRDPALWHGISKVKLPQPISEMTATHVPTGPAPAEKIITPSDLQGGLLLPALGDRSAAGSTLTAVGETPLANPVPMQGGHGYMAAQSPEGAVWASAPSVASRLGNTVRDLSKTTGKPVYLPYTAMGERSVDFSHHASDTLANMLADAAVGRRDLGSFNAAMRRTDANFGPVRDWPGVQADDLAAYLREGGGDVRNKFAKTMDTRQFQEAGFPSVAEARFAVTDPRLLNVPTGASGLSIARADPTGRTFTEGAQHLTYPTKLAGTYEGGFGTSVPKEIMFPDMINAYRRLGYEPYRHDYLMARGVEGAPTYQRANQQWVDRISKWLEKNQR